MPTRASAFKDESGLSRIQPGLQMLGCVKEKTEGWLEWLNRFGLVDEGMSED